MKNKTKQNNNGPWYTQLSVQKKITIILLILLLFVAGWMKSVLVIILLLAANLLLSFLIRPFSYFLGGIEIVTLITITTSLAYGSFIGVLAGVIALIVKIILVAKLTARILVLVPTIMAIAIFVPLVPVGITTIGIIAAIIYNIMVILSAFVFGGDIPKAFVYFVVNTLWNVFIFSAIAPGLLQIMM